MVKTLVLILAGLLTLSFASSARATTLSGTAVANQRQGSGVLISLRTSKGSLFRLTLGKNTRVTTADGHALQPAGSDRELVFGPAGGQMLCSALPAAIADLAGIGRRAAQVSAEISGDEVRHHNLKRLIISSPYLASWKMMPSVWRCPERKRLTPCRRLTRWAPRFPCTGR